MNDESLHEKQRFFSSYEIEEERFWVLTTADRSGTMVFLPGDTALDPFCGVPGDRESEAEPG